MNGQAGAAGTAGAANGPARDPDCIFCRVVAGEIPSNRVAEDDASPDDVVPWEQVKAQTLARLKP